MDRDLAAAVLSDLEHIAEVGGAHATYHQLRRLSVQLRGLVNDDLLIRCWREQQLQPKQPRVRAYRLYIDDLGERDWAFSAGATYDGTRLMNVRFYSRALTPDEIRKFKSDEPLHDFPMHEYRDSAAAWVYGHRIKRFHIIAYVANKRGGAHLDQKRKKDEQSYAALDRVAKEAYLGGDDDGVSAHDPISFEILSICQDLTSSEDIMRLMEQLRRVT